MSFSKLFTAVLLVAGLFAGIPARAETEVDLALVLAVDISFSMDPDEQTLQRDGFVQAFRSSAVHDAIRRGQLGRIAVSYMEWAGAFDQRVVVPWSVIDGPESAAAFAQVLSEKPTRRASRTSVSGAIDFATKMLSESDYAATRKVIDVSGDGPNNHGRPVTVARAEALAKGVTINGLPIMLKTPGYFDIVELDTYYRDCVIGGPGAFMVPAREREQFREAIKTKLVLEVAVRPDPALAPGRLAGARIVLAASNGRASNCMAGEAQWRDRMGN